MNAAAHSAVELAGLLSKAGLSPVIKSIVARKTSGNNRSYRLETSDGVFALKEYFRHTEDSRDRLTAEFDFCRYAAKIAPGMAPLPLARDAESGLALYEYVEGRPYTAGQVTWTDVRGAIDFFAALNTPAARAQALALPVASEARFSLAAHLDLVSQRLDTLAGAEPKSAEDHEAVGLIDRIRRRWQDMSRDLLDQARRRGFDPDAVLEPNQRCISPSDFGFHNALIEVGGSIRFLDFEYAGWDDPGKMVGDFFAQLAIPVPAEFFDRFVEESMASFTSPHDLTLRAKLLRPVYQVKWCCIALNVFLPAHLLRRKFADPTLDEAVLKRSQIDKAARLFQSISTSDHDLH
jgi:hypothetical protein